MAATGQYVVSGAWDNTARVWNLADGHCVRTVAAHVSDVRAAAFSPDGHALASVSRDGSLRPWRRPTPDERITAYAIILKTVDLTVTYGGLPHTFTLARWGRGFLFLVSERGCWNWFVRCQSGELALAEFSGEALKQKQEQNLCARLDLPTAKRCHVGKF